MFVKTSNDVFHITFSKWKVGLYTFLCWGLACLPILAAALFAEDLLTGKGGSTSLYLTLIFGAIGLLFTAVPFIFLRWLNKPFVSISRGGFSSQSFLKQRSFVWTPQTVIFRGYKTLMLANLDPSQSRASKLWRGPKEAVMIGHALIAENQYDVLAAIDRLSPYPVKRTSIWRAAMH